MGDSAGRVLLNGNAETLERFASLAHRGVGPSQHRDDAARARDRVVVCTGAWGAGEPGDAPLRRAFAALGRGRRGRYVENLGVYAAMHRFLAEREVVRALCGEHEHVWRALLDTYVAENDATVARMREAWSKAHELAPELGMNAVLHTGEHLAPGPRTRPVGHLLRSHLAGQVGRAVTQLVEADNRRSNDLAALWSHFHVAAGLEFDPLWSELRAGLVDRLLDASMLVLPGGSPSLLLVCLRFFQLEPVLTEALRRGTCFFGSSAGAMVLQRRVVLFNDRGVPRQEFHLFENGLRLIEGLQVFPHCTDRVQTDDPTNLAYLAARFRYRVCVGLNAGSVLELRPDGGRWSARSVGEEDVVLFGPLGEKRRYAPGEAVPELASAS
jgi:hypothetical protein